MRHADFVLSEVTDRGGPITAGAFNNTGTIFAYGLSYDWGAGHQGAGSVPNKIMLHALKVSFSKAVL